MSYEREAAPTSPGRLEDLTEGLQSLLSLLAPVGLALLLTAPAQAPLAGQIAVGARYGGGEGIANYNVGELNGRVGVGKRLYVIGGFEMMGGAWDLSTYAYGYDGYTISVGGAFATIDSPTFYVGARGTGGLFVRTGGDFAGSRDFSGSVGVDAEVRIWGPVRLQVGVTHQRIFDGTYQDLFGEYPHLTYATAGLTFVVRGGRNDQ